MYQSNQHNPHDDSQWASMTPTPTIYVVDDDTGVLGSLRFLLETDGFDVRTFRSAAALLNGNVADEADCFVIDYKMPAMSGIDLASRLRSRHFDAPIILITGYPDKNIEEKAAAVGITPRAAQAPSRGKPRQPYPGRHPRRSRRRRAISARDGLR